MKEYLSYRHLNSGTLTLNMKLLTLLRPLNSGFEAINRALVEYVLFLKLEAQLLLAVHFFLCRSKTASSFQLLDRKSLHALVKLPF